MRTYKAIDIVTKVTIGTVKAMNVADAYYKFDYKQDYYTTLK